MPLTKDLHVDLSDYEELPHAVLVVNPDAPTGFLKPLSAIKKLVASHPERLVIVDEAYIDFGGESETAISLVNDFSNVIVVRTFQNLVNWLALVLAMPWLVKSSSKIWKL